MLDSLNDERAAAMLKGLPVGEHVFGGDDYPVPLIDEQSVRRYLDCIEAARAEILPASVLQINKSTLSVR